MDYAWFHKKTHSKITKQALPSYPLATTLYPKIIYLNYFKV